MKIKRRHNRALLFIFSASIFLAPEISCAENAPALIPVALTPGDSAIVSAANGAQSLSAVQRKRLAQSFVSRMKRSLTVADTLAAQTTAGQAPENILPEGEMLLLLPVFPPFYRAEGVVGATVKGGEVLLSLTDFITVLDLPITLDVAAGKASGWYLRENKTFALDIPGGFAQTDQGRFDLPATLTQQDNDIYISVDDLAQWMGISLKLDVGAQELAIKSDIPFPFEDRLNRRKLSFGDQRQSTPQLPRREDPYKRVDAPTIDVATSSNFRRSPDMAEPFKNHNVNIRTAGDLAGGTVITQSLINNRDQLTSISALYKRESDKPELLGPLKARSFAVGDVTTARLPVAGSAKQEFGGRVTNADPNRGTLRPTTVISGSAIPGWDVELYRDSQIVAFQEVGDDGFYAFEDVKLFQDDNRFRVVFYGPQGEIVEENVFVPVDIDALAGGRGVYDVSLTFNDKRTYVKRSLDSYEGEHAPNVVAFYERSLGSGLTGSVGMRSTEVLDQRNTIATAGISTIALQTLLNADAAVDDEGQMLGELSARRSFGDNNLSNTLRFTGDGFDSQNGTEQDGESLENVINFEGALPSGFIRSPRYFVGSRFEDSAKRGTAMDTSIGVSGGYKRLSMSQELEYNDVIKEPDQNSRRFATEDRLSLNSNLNGMFGQNRLRLSSNYELKPDSELKRVLATYNRDITRDLSFEAGWTKTMPEKLSEYSARLDWQSGFIRLSPRITYNTRDEFFAGLNTQFGLMREPRRGDIKSYDRSITGNGGLSAFVYLDANGDSQFNEGDEVLPNVVVEAAQNGGRETTDENGIALFNRLSETRPTDVVIDPESLGDPTWVIGYEGASILPRAGYVAAIEFPVHIGGEVDGNVYLGAAQNTPLRNITLRLYNAEGNVEQSVVTDDAGFYYLSRIPPGRYFLIIDEKSARRGNFIRPEPQPIEIGYNGTVLFGNNIVVTGGQGDVPSEIMANRADFKTLYPGIDFEKTPFDIVLNLGAYNSNVLMSVVWYKLRTRYAPIIAGGTLFIPPTASAPDPKTGKHTLRVGLAGETIGGAYQRCRALIARGRECKVEIYPANMRQANAPVAAQAPEALPEIATEDRAELALPKDKG